VSTRMSVRMSESAKRAWDRRRKAFDDQLKADNALLERADELIAENALLRKALADAPHAYGCGWFSWGYDVERANAACNCWKAAAPRTQEKP
jgi:hypothetical protein